MNVKKSAKKVFAIATGLALVGTTIMGALAYDLSNYPAPFVQDGMAKGVIVVGQNAATSDVLGAIDIAASLQAAAVTGTEIAGSNSVNVEGGKSFDDLWLYNNSLAFDDKLDDADLNGFVDSTFNYNDKDIDYEDYIVLPDGNVSFEGSQYDEDFGKDIYATIANPENIKYIVKLKGNVTGVGTSGNDKDFEFNMLGKKVKITHVDAASDSVTIESAAEQFMQEGDQVTVDGHTVTLKKVGDGSVLVDVDGQILSVKSNGATSSDNTETFDQADDFEVEVESAFYIQDATDNSATLKLGNSISSTVQNGDSAEMFGLPSDEDNSDWVWYVDADSSRTFVGLQLNIERTDLTASGPDERNALAVGDSLDLPYNYASISYEGLGVNKFDNVKVDVDKNINVKNSDGTQEVKHGWGYHFTADKQIFSIGSNDVDEVWAVNNGTDTTLWYKDNTDESLTSGTSFQIKADSEVTTVDVSGMNGKKLATGNSTTDPQIINITLPVTGEVMTLNATAGNDFFGPNDDEDNEDFSLSNSVKSTVTGKTDYDGGYVMTKYGAYFETPKAQFSSGSSFEFYLPSERQYAEIVVSSKGSTVSAGSEGGMSYTVNPIALGLGVLDTDTTLGSKPMIIVGGPRANTVAADFLGNPTDAQIANTFEAGKALIKYDDAKKAMLVAGWDKQETLGASYVVAKYKNYDFSGNEMEVTVTDLSNIEVNAVN